MQSDVEYMDVWLALRTGESGASEMLVARYLPWAERLADRIHRRVFAMRIPREDLRQSASVGLLEAIARFDPMRGIPFPGYAVARVRGAVFNEIRHFNDAPERPGGERLQLERLQSLRRGPGEAEPGLLDQLVDDIVGLGLAFLLDTEAAQPAGDLCPAQDYAERSLTHRRLRSAMLRLPERSRLLIQAHYFEHLPFKTLATRLGVSKGRVSQLHHAALAELRRALTVPSA